MDVCQHSIVIAFLRSTYASNNTKTSGIGNRGSQLGTSSDIHTSQQYWVLDLQKISGRCSELLRRRHLDLDLNVTLEDKWG